MDDAQWDEIDGLMMGCVDALFRAIGVPLPGDARRDEGHEIVAVIGLGGQQLKGTLLLALPWDVLANSYPDLVVAPDVEALRDWSGELVNQLAGRLKNQLLRRGIVIELSLPTAISGVDLGAGARSTWSSRAAHRFTAGVGNAKVRLELMGPSRVALATDGAPVMHESEVALF